MENYLKYLLILYFIVKHTTQETCRSALGMNDMRIQGSQLKASSVYGDDPLSYGPQNARLNLNIGGGAWCPVSARPAETTPEFLEINFISMTMFTALSIQGRWDYGYGREFVSKFRLEYTGEGGKWMSYKDQNLTTIFDGNWDTLTVKTVNLSPEVIANRIRIVPVVEEVTQVCMRVELYGCLWEDGINDTDVATLTDGTCASLKPRRYDIEDLGSDCLFRGWADVQAQGAANDYCRVITKGGPTFLSCALAGASDDHVYTSPNASVDWFDAGHTDTWYMKDEDGDGRDDYCRCVGIPPDTFISCMKADESGFMGHDDFRIDGITKCEYNKVNPFVGAP